jgi:hypothetical protein
MYIYIHVYVTKDNVINVYIQFYVGGRLQRPQQQQPKPYIYMYMYTYIYICRNILKYTFICKYF